MFAYALIGLVSSAAPAPAPAASDAGVSDADALRACLKTKAKTIEAACVVKGAVVDTGPAEATRIDAAKAFMTEQASAWNKGDLEGFTASYADDATFITPTGLTKGREQVLARYKKRYPDKAAMGTLSFEFLDARAAPGSVTVMAKWTLSYPNKPSASGNTLVVLHPRGASWLVVQDASM
ncbi:MAG: nuclear transport factor 2 family protein [Myxococcaceae bacterium]|nr:nuclear transport factor 2 family protein [Myxococcaceae bacterium]